ncbi:hypothetical protein PEX1_079740 [Penicillium expansum]|uniref:Uncharacterized protein n=1 Tax=Penicillium expansum TaxID=27334 RepID=A0A0A2L3C3_PENEN|nr:hypothetical protein PEX2_046560 [Penicillium expansum]KGO62630.1 hypothetical protein PEX2_046560 [Penicillium expansum]KGO73673.1 hypothetical protein PEX1_079740 [Penicillium expansum]
MADLIRPALFCKHCEIDGHDVVHCHRLFKDLTSFATAVGIPTGQRTQSSIYQTSGMRTPYRVARWGKRKKSINYASFTAASGVPGQGNHTSSTLRTYLNPVEAQMLANYLEQHRRQWLSRRNFWAHLFMYEVPWQQEHGSDVPR